MNDKCPLCDITTGHSHFSYDIAEYVDACKSVLADAETQRDMNDVYIDTLRWQLESVKSELTGFKSGTKEGVAILKAELKRVEVERDTLRKQLEMAMEAIEQIESYSEQYQTEQCIYITKLAHDADAKINRIGEKNE